ncbi:MAG: PAS domain S-box protein [Sedimentisphaerales bacterium]
MPDKRKKSAEPGDSKLQHKQAEGSLQKSELLYQTLMKNINLGITLINTEYRIVATNVGQGLILRKPHSKLIGEYCFREFEKRSAVCSHCPGRRAMATGRPAEVETEGVRDDGSRVPARVQAFPVFETDGTVKGFLEVVEDITERKRVEEELRESEIKIRAIFDQTFQFIGLMNIDGTLIEANRAALEFSGIESSSVLNKPFWQGPWWTHSPELQEKLRRSVGKAARGEFIRFEATHVAKDGMLHHIDFSLKPVKDETGKVIFLIPEGRDITEHRQAEEKLRESEQRFKAIFDNTPDGILLADAESKKFYLGNKAICQMLGCKPEEIKNMTVSDIHLKEHLPYVLEQFEKLARKEITLAEDIPVKRKDGSVFYVDIGSFPIVLAGKTYIAGIFRDVTERKRIEEELNIYREKMAQAERLASLGTLSATVAHEMTQPLTVIRLSIENSLEDLQASSCPKTVLDVLRDGLNEVSNATSVVDRFRNYARQSSKKPLSETDLGAVADRIVRLLGRAAQRAKMTLHLKGMDKLPPVYSNERDIEQLLFALIENAIHAADGKKNHRLTIEGVVEGKNIELRFSDNCSGIDPENLDKIFDPFFTTGADDARTGLGLPIVQKIISGYGGKIRVQSRLGKGTTFYVTLPIYSETVK